MTAVGIICVRVLPLFAALAPCLRPAGSRGCVLGDLTVALQAAEYVARLAAQVPCSNNSH